MNKEFYLDDYSAEDILKKLNFIKSNINDELFDESLEESFDESLEESFDESLDNSSEENKENKEKNTKPSFSMKPNYNSKGERVVVFSINIPLKNNGLKIDILINNDMYKNIGKHFKK
jgi:hypothetical protein